MNSFTESVVEDAALAWLEGVGYAVLHGSAIVMDTPLIGLDGTTSRSAAALLR